MKKMIGKRKTILIAAVIVLLTVSVANAALITIAVEGTIDAVSDPANHLEGKISVDDTITGYYTYESTTPDDNGSSTVGEYWHYNSPCGIFLNSGGFDFKTDMSDVEFQLDVLNNHISNKDKYFIQSYNNSSLSNGVIIEEIIWSIEDLTGTALTSDALPTTAPALSDWEDNRLNVHGGPRGAEFGFDAVVTSATVVPEPLSILFMLLGTGFLRRRLH